MITLSQFLAFIVMYFDFSYMAKTTNLCYCDVTWWRHWFLFLFYSENSKILSL